MPSNLGLLTTIKRQRASRRLPYGENPISTAARFLLDRNNNFVPVSSVVFVSTASVTVGNSAVEATIVGAGQGSLVLPADFLRPGTMIKVRASGTYGTKASTVGNLVLKLKAGTVALATATVAALASSMSGRRFVAEIEMVCRTGGAAGTVQASGNFRHATAASTMLEEVFAETATSSFSTLAPQTLDLTAAWATEDVGNTLTCSLCSFTVIPGA